MKFAALHRTRLAVAVSAAALSLAAGHALGSNFALQEQSGSGVGNAFAGGAAAAEDASTVWSNPAGMSRIPGIQGVVAGDIVCISADFKARRSSSGLLLGIGTMALRRGRGHDRVAAFAGAQRQ